MNNKGIDNFIIESPIFDKRGFRQERCKRCHLPTLACICKFAPSIATNVNFWLLVHELEFFKPTNTGKLIAESIENTYSFTWRRKEDPENLIKMIESNKYNPYVIFPDDNDEYNPRVQEYKEIKGKDPAFIIIDGTWSQARKIFRKSVYLEKIPMLSLNTNRESEYILRSPSEKNHICTVEVAIELLKITGDSKASQELENYFKLFLKYYLAGRNNHLPLED